ncbi:hypothetical protein LIER_05483 [Lithospermum erythrorhizon]|uniref:Uncharacterized protein n=1 Tax=Lithospermum erythrorhizon TaxID=34254 RepID=A0AAV3P2I4_LITER
MLISFIMKRWDVLLEYGSPTPPPTPIGNKPLEVEGEDVDVEGEEIRSEPQGGAYGSRDHIRDNKDLRSELRRLATVQEQQGRDIKKNKRYTERDYEVLKLLWQMRGIIM